MQPRVVMVEMNPVGVTQALQIILVLRMNTVIREFVRRNVRMESAMKLRVVTTIGVRYFVEVTSAPTRPAAKLVLVHG